MEGRVMRRTTGYVVCKTEYYDKFVCVADRCEATCCAGWQILYGEGMETYYELQKGFKEYCAQECFDGVSMDIILEQLAVYFVFAYFCSAVYDDNVIGKIRMAMDSVTVLHKMFAAKWAEQDGYLSAKDIPKMVYRYSRELEHSDVNLEIIQNV